MSNKSIMKYLGITKWHEAGYTGKGIKIMSLEPVSSKSKFPNVIAVDGYNKGKKNEVNHADKVMEQMMEIAPNATYITCSEESNTDDWKPLFLDYILKNNVHLFTTSKLSDIYETSQSRENQMQKCIDNGTTFFIAVGNTKPLGSKKIYAEAKSDKYLTIGACLYDSGDVGQAFYSCEGEELDYMTISGWDDEVGTSFATNRFSAMCALVQEFFYEKIGRTLYRHELINFINDNVKDLKTEGHDIYTGHGLFILPDPETIDISKYVKEEEMEKYIMDIIPKNNINRTNLFFVPTYITIHNTDNYNKGANAKAHGNYLKNVDSKVSWHYTVDDTYIVQHLSDNECGYHTGDGMGEMSGNRNSIGIEICVNEDGDLLKATENAIGLVKKLMKAYNIPIENVVQHYHWSGKDCPHELRLGNPYTWETFINKLKEGKPMEEVSDWAKTAWHWATEKGYLDGTNPKGTVTREMLAQVLFNLFGKGDSNVG